MLEKGYCKQIEPNCRTFDATGNCLNCKFKYILFDGVCLRLAPESYDYVDYHCSRWWAGICMSCDSGWTINNDTYRCEQDTTQAQGAGTPIGSSNLSSSPTTKQTAVDPKQTVSPKALRQQP